MTFKTFHEVFWLCVFIAVWLWMVRFVYGKVLPAFRSGALVLPKKTINRAGQPAFFWLAIIFWILAFLVLSLGILVQATLLLAQRAGIP